MRHLKNENGFSILEVVLAMSLLAILMGIATINLFSATNKTYQNTATAILYTDLKSQQIKAMNGDTNGSGTTGAYGVYFLPTQYILFQGITYSPSNPTNFAVKIPDDVKFTNILFPNSQIIFASGSGEFANFANGQNSVVINGTGGSLGQKTVTINRFGVVTSN
jgi:prepilin-type N-terminal cleavage/methylation domain-containing protein